MNVNSSQSRTGGFFRSIGDFAGRIVNKAAVAVVDWSVSEQPSTHPALNDQDRVELREKMQPGDVLLVTNTESPILQTLSYFGLGSHYTHCGIYTDKNSFIESQDTVVETSYDVFISGKQKVAIVRPPYKSEADAQQVIRESYNLLGTPYDYMADHTDDSEVACTELIEVAMKRVDQDLDVKEKKVLGFEITPPDGFIEMEGATLVHDGKSNYWKNKLSQWPKHLLTTAGVVAGGVTLGPLGAVLGGVFASSSYQAATTHKGAIETSPLTQKIHELVETSVQKLSLSPSD